MEPNSARKAALKEFGNVEALKENSRESLSINWIMGMVREFRIGLRLLLKHKGFTVVVVSTLAICLAGNTVIFTLLDQALGPPSYAEPDRVFQVYNAYPARPQFSKVLGGSSNPGCYVDFYKNADLFESWGLIKARVVNISHGETTVRRQGLEVSRQFFDMVGLKPIIGSYFSDPDFIETDYEEFPVILSESFWRNQLGSDETIIGKTIYLNSLPNTVLGVAPTEVESFFFNPSFYRPYANLLEYSQAELDRMRHYNANLLWGRLKKGVTPAQAKAQLDALDQRYFDSASPQEQEALTSANHETRMATFQQIAKSMHGRMLYLLQASSFIVLLIGCLNIANLLVARGFKRKSELALRAAMGASRWILFRQLLMECFVLAAAGCIFGLLLTWPISGLINRFLITDLQIGNTIESIQLSGVTIFFMVVISIAVGLLLGVFSSISLLYSKRKLIGAIQEGSTQHTSSRSIRYLRASLVSLQICLTVVLLLGAALLIESFRKAVTQDSGIDTKNLYVSSVHMAWGKYGRGKDGGEGKARFRNQLRESLTRAPGIDSVVFTSYLPAVDFTMNPPIHKLQGAPALPEGEVVRARYRAVPPGFFEIFGINLLRGRYFDTSDMNQAGLPCIIDRTFAERYFKEADPIGKYIYISPDPNFDPENFDPANTPLIVGVVENIRHFGLDDRYIPNDSSPWPMIYAVEKQADFISHFNIFIKSNRPAGEIYDLVRNSVQALDDQLPVYRNESMEFIVHGLLNDRRAYMILGTILSVMAILLSAIGIFGVLSYDVTQRTREIGLRMAMGATRNRIAKLVFQQSAAKVAIGIIIGTLAAYFLSSRISDYLYQVSNTEPVAYVGVVLFVILIAIFASYLPTRRALNTDPMQALRTE